MRQPAHRLGVTTIDNATTGTLATLATDTATALFDTIGTYVTADKAVTLTNDPTATQLAAIDVALSGTATELIDGLAGISSHRCVTTIDLTAQLAAINNATMATSRSMI